MRKVIVGSYTEMGWFIRQERAGEVCDTSLMKTGMNCSSRVSMARHTNLCPCLISSHHISTSKSYDESLFSVFYYLRHLLKPKYTEKNRVRLKAEPEEKIEDAGLWSTVYTVPEMLSAT